MRFSILIPVYNVERYLPECLASVDAQSFRDYEVVLVNDGSTDSSQRLCREFASTHAHKTLLIEQENRGLLMARRAAIDVARGDYLVCLDSDDKLRADALEVISDVIERTRADLISFNLSRTENFDAPVVNHGPLLTAVKDDGVASVSSARAALCTSHDFNQMCGKAIRRECAGIGMDFRSYEGIQLGEDVVQVAVVLDHVKTVAPIDDCLYYYRPNQTSISKSVDSRHPHDIVRAYRCLETHAIRWDESLVPSLLAVECASLLSCAFKTANRLHYKEAIAGIGDISSMMGKNNLARRADLSILKAWKRPFIVMLAEGWLRLFYISALTAIRLDDCLGLGKLSNYC